MPVPCSATFCILVARGNDESELETLGKATRFERFIVDIDLNRRTSESTSAEECKGGEEINAW